MGMMGIDGETGKIVNVKDAGILDSYAVKQQVMRASIETAAMLLRIDQIVSGVSHQKKEKLGASQSATVTVRRSPRAEWICSARHFIFSLFHSIPFLTYDYQETKGDTAFSTNALRVSARQVHTRLFLESPSNPCQK